MGLMFIVLYDNIISYFKRCCNRFISLIEFVFCTIVIFFDFLFDKRA